MNKQLFSYIYVLCASFFIPFVLHAEVISTVFCEKAKPMKHHQRGMYGNYPKRREASGTSWVPDSSPMEGIHFQYHDWSYMLHGFAYPIFDHQRGKRGDKAFFCENMLMLTAQETIGCNTLAFRGMIGLEPSTIGACGYPLLFQTGETCDGVTPLIDRQHPHDLFMELAAVYSHLFDNGSSLFFYAGLPGEPALGPPVFMMRFSAEYNPAAPLIHHWTDSTHITFGVLTCGYVYNKVKFELCAFKGREPDEFRYDIEKPKLDSVSLRFSWNPTENWSLQASYGFLHSPEQLEPDVNQQRATMSAIYNKNIGDCSNLQAALILGIDRNKPGNTLPGLLAEMTYEHNKRHLFFSRFEYVKNDELFEEPDPLAGKKFDINKFTLGYVLEHVFHHVKFGVGGLVDFPIISRTLKEQYGKTFSYMVFLQMRIV